MKYLKFTLGILSLLVLGFLLIGIIKPELSYDFEILVEKPLAESWAVSQDEEKMSMWLDGFQNIEHISGTPNTVGAVSDVYFTSGGKQIVIRETITNIVPKETISMVFTSDFMEMGYKFSLSNLDGQTKINTSTTSVGNNLISKSMIALMANSMKEQEQKNLENLKKTIEENTKNYYPIEED